VSQNSSWNAFVEYKLTLLSKKNHLQLSQQINVIVNLFFQNQVKKDSSILYAIYYNALYNAGRWTTSSGHL